VSQEPLYLTEVRRLPDRRRLRLTWNDGHSAELDYDLLRGYCPCATCQGHGPAAVAFHRPPRPVTPVDIEEVGNYAISIGWSDRHATGIYRFDFLRELAAKPPPSPEPP
jgi:DUF971 family protein